MSDINIDLYKEAAAERFEAQVKLEYAFTLANVELLMELMKINEDHNIKVNSRTRDYVMTRITNKISELYDERKDLNPELGCYPTQYYLALKKINGSIQALKETRIKLINLGE